MMNNEKFSKEENEVYEILEIELDNIKNIIKGDIFITSIFLFKYIDSLDNKYWIMFLHLFEKLSFEEQIEVLKNVSFKLKAEKNKIENNKHNKVK